jgi:hypothetical protein
MMYPSYIFIFKEVIKLSDPNDEEKNPEEITDFDQFDYEGELEKMFPNEDDREDFVTQNM